MAVQTVRVLGDPVLRQKAKKVTKVDASIQSFIDDMIETMPAAGGVGLAAPQIGRALRIIVIGEPDKEIIVLINPQIVRRSGQRQVVEGCLSVPGYWAEIARSEKVTVKGLDREGREVRIKGEDLLAQALEHEIDHINGVLYVDHLESMDQLNKVEPEAREEAGASEPAAVPDGGTSPGS